MAAADASAHTFPHEWWVEVVAVVGRQLPPVSVCESSAALGSGRSLVSLIHS